MRGFFSNEEIGAYDGDCAGCGLDKTCATPRMKYSGKGERQILIIAEAPGETEDIQGTQLVGEAGQLLRNKLEKIDLDLDRDFWKINAVNCRPPKNRKPSKKELKACKPNIDKAINKLKPKAIWLMGGAALESFYLDKFSDCSITRWRKRCIPDFTANSFIVPMFHPSYLLRKKDEKLSMVFESDLKFAISCCGKEFPKPVDLIVNKLVNYNELIHVLDMTEQSAKLLYHDYETNALNPYKVDPKILSISFRSENNTYAFPLDYPGAWTIEQKKTIEKYWVSLLLKIDIEKLAHNFKFEDKWARARFGITPQGWYWDTMVTQHILDEREGVTGLKYQAYVRWGVEDYEKEAKKYIESTKPDGTNRLDELPLDKLLDYNGADSILGLKLFKEQQQEIKRPRFLLEGNDLLFKGTLAFCDIEENGIPLNTAHYINEQKKLEVKIAETEKRLNDSRDAKLFRKHYGVPIDFASTDDIRKLIYDVLKIEPFKKTTHGFNSADQEVLEKIDRPFAKDLIMLRKLEKVNGTYIAQFLREGCPDGKLHPFFNLHFARTYRSSSSNPNFQNIPVRDEEAKSITRKGIIPSPGNKILEVDYGSMEVRIIACHSKDKELIRRIDDPHYEWAKKLFLLADEEMTKDIRYVTKSSFIFPEFYGSYYISCARDLWEDAQTLKTKTGINLIDHLNSKGFGHPLNFEEHIKKVEARFWELFWETREWQKKVEQAYLKTGYVPLITGFYRQGYLTRNMLYNTPIQGAAFHCLLWSLIELNKICKELNLKSKIIGQIHDSIIWDLHPTEEKVVMSQSKFVMTEKIKDKYKWIIVPLLAEFDMTEIDNAWYYKKGVTYEG